MPNPTQLIPILTGCGIELPFKAAIIHSFPAVDTNGRFLTPYGGEKVNFFGHIVPKNNTNWGLFRPQNSVRRK